ncbi:MAG: hypothetical protein QXN37_02200 [Candidatus Anstonellaceae archaeon]
MEKQALLEKARRLENKQFFVKAAEVYLSVGMEKEAAEAYEKGGDFEKALKLFEKLGQTEAARRCRHKLEESFSGRTWKDLQAEFQKEKGNPY